MPLIISPEDHVCILGYDFRLLSVETAVKSWESSKVRVKFGKNVWNNRKISQNKFDTYQIDGTMHVDQLAGKGKKWLISNTRRTSGGRSGKKAFLLLLIGERTEETLFRILPWHVRTHCSKVLKSSNLTSS